MISEVKILFNNIKNFRNLLTEGVGQDVIKKAIENHEWLYIYYNADNKEGKNAGGVRTIRPYVLGTNKSNHVVLRAWQDNPKNSWHFNNKPTRPADNPDMAASQYHDYWSDHEGVKPGWRLFDVDKISKVYPIGKKFNDSRGGPMIPAGYHEGGDKNMTSIIAQVSTSDKPDLDIKFQKDVQIDKISKGDRDKAKWDSIRRGNKNRKKITADDVVKLSDVASRIQKTAKGNYLVVIDDKDDFQLMFTKDKDKQNIPDIAIVGSLPYLYDSLVKGNAPADEKFFNDVKNKTQAEINSANTTEPQIGENKNSTIPYKKMTFFK